MGKGESAHEGNGRLSRRLQAELDPDLQSALDSPVRRDVLRAIRRRGQSVSISELLADLHPYRQGQLEYHLQVLRRVGAVMSRSANANSDLASARYSSTVLENGPILAILRATKRRDCEQRDASATANASPLLTMFRAPRPVRTIRLRSQRELDAEREP